MKNNRFATQSDALSDVCTQFVKAEEARYPFNSVLRPKRKPLKGRPQAGCMHPCAPGFDCRGLHRVAVAASKAPKKLVPLHLHVRLKPFQ
jgi:hypothetical protein